MHTTANTEHETFQTAKVSLVALAHATHDTYTGFLPALLPVLIEKFSLTNTSAGFLSLLTTAPSLLQPLIGHLADRKNLRFLLVVAPAITGAAMSLLSITPSYGFLAFLLILAGISSATLHAIGPVLGSTFSGVRLGKGTSFWMVGGELGRSLGPLVVVSAITYLTVTGIPWLMLAGVLVSMFLFIKLRSVVRQPIVQVEKTHNRLDAGAVLKFFIPFTFLLMMRLLVVSALTVYLPTFLTEQGTTLWVAGASLSILQAAGVVGAFLAGTLSDRVGRRKLLLISYIATPICMLLFTYVKGFWQIPLLLALGFFSISITPVLMAMVLEHFGGNRSFANGMYMAVDFLLRSIAVLIAGSLADLRGLQFAFLVSAAVVPLGLPFLLLLPRSKANSIGQA